MDFELRGHEDTAVSVIFFSIHLWAGILDQYSIHGITVTPEINNIIIIYFSSEFVFLVERELCCELRMRYIFFV